MHIDIPSAFDWFVVTGNPHATAIDADFDVIAHQILSLLRCPPAHNHRRVSVSDGNNRPWDRGQV